MSGFSNPVIGGSDTLIRKAIRSPNYVAGTSGWSINKDGSAEFNNLTSRGTVIVGTPSGAHILMSTTIPAPLVAWSADFVWSAAQIMYVSAVDFQWKAVGSFVGAGGPLEVYAEGTYSNTAGLVTVNNIIQDFGSGAGFTTYLYGSQTYNANQIIWNYRHGSMILAGTVDFTCNGAGSFGSTLDVNGNATFAADLAMLSTNFFDPHLSDQLAWIPYTPTWAGSVTNPTLGTGGFINGFYRYQNSREIQFHWLAIMGAGATKGSGTYTLTVPVVTSDLHAFGSTGQWHFNDSGSALRDGSVIFDNSTSKISFSVPGGGAPLGSATLGGTFASSLFQGSIKYIV